VADGGRGGFLFGANVEKTNVDNAFPCADPRHSRRNAANSLSEGKCLADRKKRFCSEQPDPISTAFHRKFHIFDDCGRWP